MKSKKTQFEMDIIGGEGSLTVAEEKALSEFFRQRKLTSKKSSGIYTPKKTKRPEVTA